VKDPIQKMKNPRPLKADLHLHTAEDPLDPVRYTAKQLITKAADEGFDVISITNHQQITFNQELLSWAQARGILLIPGVEMTIRQCHVLILNPPPGCEPCSDFFSLSKLRRPETLIVAPHPYFPGPFSLKKNLSRHLHLFDALEYSHFYSRMINFNRKAVELSLSLGFPLIANSDAHFFSQFGATYSLIYAEKNIESVFAAIRENKVKILSHPLNPFQMAWIANRFLGMAFRTKWVNPQAVSRSMNP
jgi:predicted metal-dependent phosphoesterase TrpH